MQLLKWKLVVIAGIGAPALGFTNVQGPTGSHLALAMIPLACLYIDILCRELSIRAKRISVFLAHNQKADDLAKVFESFYQRTKIGPSMESFALVYSTVVVSLLVLIIGGMLSNIVRDWMVFVTSTVVGLAGSRFIHTQYSKRLNRLKKQSSKFSDDQTAG